jgi:hypothetical protein
MLASSGGVLNVSEILTRTNGLAAISAMLEAGNCCATAGDTAATDKSIINNDLRMDTPLTPELFEAEWVSVGR